MPLTNRFFCAASRQNVCERGVLRARSLTHFLSWRWRFPAAGGTRDRLNSEMERNQTRQEFAHSERKGNFFFPSRLIFVDCTPTKDPLELGSNIQALGDCEQRAVPFFFFLQPRRMAGNWMGAGLMRPAIGRRILEFSPFS